MDVKRVLEKRGSVAEVKKEKRRSFDIAFAEERAFLIKVVANVESFSQDQAEALKKSASVVGAEPIVISESVKEGAIYRRHEVPVMRMKTFLDYIEGKKLAIADRGCVKVPVKGVREAREAKGISRGMLAKMLGVSKEMVRRYEEGEAFPSREVAEKMVRILGKRILKEVRFETQRLKKAFIGRGPFELALRKRKPILVSFRKDEIRVKNLEGVSSVLKAKAVFAEDEDLEEVI